VVLAGCRKNRFPSKYSFRTLQKVGFFPQVLSRSFAGEITEGEQAAEDLFGSRYAISYFGSPG
jgi:hypothetical protein